MTIASKALHQIKHNWGSPGYNIEHWLQAFLPIKLLSSSTTVSVTAARLSAQKLKYCFKVLNNDFIKSETYYTYLLLLAYHFSAIYNTLNLPESSCWSIASVRILLHAVPINSPSPDNDQKFLTVYILNHMESNNKGWPSGP